MSDLDTPLPAIENDNGKESKPLTHGDDVSIEAPVTPETLTAASKRERESGEIPPRHKRKLDYADDVNDDDGDGDGDGDEVLDIDEASMTEEAQSQVILQPAPTKLTVKTWTDHNDLVWDPAKKVPLRSLPKEDGDGLTGISKGVSG
jgi:hypothetical protein